MSNGALAAALVTVLAAIALVVKPPSPPGIAAFAPQASKPITKAPPGQAALSGEGPGSCVAGQRCASPPARPTPLPPSSTLPAAPGVPSTYQCYLWPDGSVTQTYDRQSPPCIASWDDAKGNGGATTMGVTGTAIRIAGGTSPTGTLDRSDWLTPLLNFINSHYQLYDRKLIYEHVPAPGGGQRDSSSRARAHAVDIASHKPFAAISGAGGGELASDVFAATLAQRRVLHVIRGMRSTITSDLLRRHAPYLWTVNPPIDVMQRHVAAFVCRALNGRSADYAGGDLRGKPRKFVVGYDEESSFERHADPAPLVAALRGCGAPVRTVEFPASDPAAGAALWQQLRTEGRTTVLWNDRVKNLTAAMLGADAAYQPEWVPVGFIEDEEVEYLWQGTWGGPPEQQRHLFGPWPFNKTLNAVDTPARRAYLDGGGNPGTKWSGEKHQIYRALTLLAAGIQMAGPRLSAATFESGLHTTAFPNPAAAAAPEYQARVGFTDGDHTLGDDVALVWWNPQGRSKNGYGDASDSTGVGAWCFLGRGQRFTLDSWPRETPLQEPGDCG